MTHNLTNISAQRTPNMGEHVISRRTLLTGSLFALGLHGCGGGGTSTPPASTTPSSTSGVNGGVVTTFAGTAGVYDTNTFLGVDGTGAAAKFSADLVSGLSGIRGISVDQNGTIYVVDGLTIRKISSSGVVTTFLGGGATGGSSGTLDGTGTAAWFNTPCGVAVDLSGNIYVADKVDNVIRKSTSAGVVTTFAGTVAQIGFADATGNAARFNAPHGLAVDSSGNVYVADKSNHRIRKITPAGVVTTLAGSSQGSVDGTGTAAKFNNPENIAVGIDGNVYVSDTYNHAIRKIVAATGVVTTVAGNANVVGYADGNDISALFFQPRGLASDTNGNLYVADSGNHAIRKITPQGVVTTLAGNNPTLGRLSGSSDGTGYSAKFYLPYALTVDRNNSIFVGDTGNAVIRKIT